MADWAVNEITGGTYLSGILNNPGDEESNSGENGGSVSVVLTNGSLCERTMCEGERKRRMSINNPAPIPVCVCVCVCVGVGVCGWVYNMYIRTCITKTSTTITYH